MFPDPPFWIGSGALWSILICDQELETNVVAGPLILRSRVSEADHETDSLQRRGFRSRAGKESVKEAHPRTKSIRRGVQSRLRDGLRFLILESTG